MSDVETHRQLRQAVHKQLVEARELIEANAIDREFLALAQRELKKLLSKLERS